MQLEITRNILLNPGPATTTDSVKFAQVVEDICPREEEFGNIVEWIQQELVKLAASKPEDNVCVLMGGSGTAAVEMTISSVIPEDAALLVVNNGAYGARITQIAKVYHIPTVEFISPNHEVINYDELRHTIQEQKTTLASQGKTLSHMAVIHHETTSGLLNDLSKLGEIAHSESLSLIVDAMSSYGAMPIDMDRDHIDFLISSSNKNIQGMAGIGIIICNTQAIEHTAHIPMRNLYLNLYDQYAYFLKTKQFRFTPPVQTMYALRQAVLETIAETVDARYERYMACYRLLRSSMTALGFKVLVEDEISSGFITTFFEPEDSKYSFDAMHDYLYAQGFTIYPGKVSQGSTFRIANIGDLYEEDIKAFIECLKKYLSDAQIEVR